MLPLIVTVSVALWLGAAPSYAATTELVVIDEAVSLAPGQVRAFNLGLRRNPAVVDASFQVLRGEDVTMMLLRRGADGQFLRVIAGRSSGSFRQAVSELGDYQVVLDNRRSRDRRVTAQLRVALDFDQRGLAAPVTVSPVRRSLILGGSALFLGLVVFYGGRRLWPAIERRRRERQFPLY